MNKLFIPFLCAMLCPSYIMSMEQNSDLTCQLYQPNITKKEIKKLHKNGVPLNHFTSDGCVYPITHWMEEYDSTYTKAWMENHNNNQISPETKKLLGQHLSAVITILEFGGIPALNEPSAYKFHNNYAEKYPSLLWGSIVKKSYNTIIKLLKFKPKEQIDITIFWKLAIKQKDAIITDLLIEHFIPEEIQEALEHTTRITYDPTIMEKLLNRGANTSKAIDYSARMLCNGSKHNSASKQNFEFLCAHGGFNQNALDSFQEKVAFYTSLIDFMNKHKPSDTSSTNSEQK